MFTRANPIEAKDLDACATTEEAKQLAHEARNAAAVNAYTFAVWCERRAAADPTPANIKQRDAAQKAAKLAADVGYAR